VHHVRIDTFDKRIAAIGYERIDFLQLVVHTRDTGRRKVRVKTGSGNKLGTSLLITRTPPMIGLCVITEALSTEAAYVTSSASTESSLDTVSTIDGARVAAVLSISASVVVHDQLDDSVMGTLKIRDDGLSTERSVIRILETTSFLWVTVVRGWTSWRGRPHLRGCI
jgi:hypothetical protein